MADEITLPRSNAQWMLEHLDMGGSMKVQLFQALSQVHMSPDLADALRRVCSERLESAGKDENGELNELGRKLDILIEQLAGL
ncbi:MAG: hypothetical protein CMK09_18380 [Ponticaulis sp.]|nr:hypothetical protein [Ponticaulis sp.]|tara:strand:- start:48676 stop:48924 length:249 start_codon:yes stop_codon:yes gene_type:complete